MSDEQEKQDDVAELIDILIAEHFGVRSLEAIKKQIRDALNKLIDERIASAFPK